VDGITYPSGYDEVDELLREHGAGARVNHPETRAQED